MEENSQEKPAQAVGGFSEFHYIPDSAGIYDSIPRYICKTCGVGVARGFEIIHIEYHSKRGDYDN